MLQTTTGPLAGNGHTDVSFSTASTWDLAPDLRAPDGSAPVAFGMIQFGAERYGPILYLIATAPNLDNADTEAHSHDADNWRMTLRGTMRMGRAVYSPGEFRFNGGRKAYPSDNLALGPDGGWAMIFFADRRGTEIRPAVPQPADATLASIEQEKKLAKWGDLRVDEGDTCGPSCLVTTLGDLSNAGALEGAFARVESWRHDAQGRAATSAVLNDVEHGPLFVFSKTPPGMACIPSGGVATEVVRVTVEGTCVIGDTEYRHGDVRIDESASTSEQAQAGSDGLTEVLIFGDRQGLFAAAATSGWPAVVQEDIHALRAKLDAQLTAV